MSSLAAVGLSLGSVLFLYMVYKFYRKSAKMSRGGKVIPGPSHWPLIGNVTQLDTTHLHNTFNGWMQEYGPLFQFKMFTQRIVVVNSAKMFRDIFDDERTKARPPSFANDFSFNGSGAVLTNFDGEQPTLKKLVWGIFLEVANDENIKELERQELNDFIATLAGTAGKDVEVYSKVYRTIGKQYLIDMLGERPEEKQADAALNYNDAIGKLFSGGLLFLLTMFPWLKYFPGKIKRIVDTATSRKQIVVDSLMETARNNYVAGKEHGMIHKFMKQMMSDTTAGHAVLKDENMFASCITDVIAGSFGETAKNIAFCILCALNHPDYLDEVRKEIDSVGSQKIDEGDEQDFPLLRAFVMECMRLGSIIHLSLPHMVTEDAVLGGFCFEKGDNILGSVYNANHDEDVWGDPWELRPSRFLDDEGNLLQPHHPYRQAFIPFGLGIRDCKGRKLAMDKIFRYVLHILHNFDISVGEGPDKLPSCDPRGFISEVGLTFPSFSCKFAPRRA